MYKVLYRAYRPETFDEMLGQKHIVKILKNQIKEDKVNHAYLFSGTRGTGKTSTARLLAKGINCLSKENKPCGTCENCISIKAGTFLDIIEIDAASNNGIDNIREIRESVKYSPVIGKKKVYIIDEVHMLSGGAFNAFLKTLEEPPEYVVFILATTEPHKLPATILSRCQRLDFKRVPELEIVDSMRDICKDQEIAIEEDALKLIAANGDGSVRDSLTLLDQCISFGEKNIAREDVLEAVGTVDSEAFIRLTYLSMQNDISEGIVFIDEILSEGRDVRQILASWLQHFRNLMLVKHLKQPEEMLNMSVENIASLREQAKHIDMSQISYGIGVVADTIQTAKTSTQPRILMEIAYIKLCDRAFANTNLTNTNQTFTVTTNKETKLNISANTLNYKTKANTNIDTSQDVNARGEVPDANVNEISADSAKDAEKALLEQLKNLGGYDDGEDKDYGDFDIEQNGTINRNDKQGVSERSETLSRNDKISSDDLEAEWNFYAQGDMSYEKESASNRNFEVKNTDINNANYETLKIDEEKSSAGNANANDNANANANGNDNADANDRDIEAAWQSVLIKGQKVQSSFAMLKFGVKPVKMTTSELVLEIPKNAGKANEIYIEKNKNLIERLLLETTGSGKKISLIREGSMEVKEKMTEVENEQNNYIETKRKIEDALGIKLEDE